MYLKRHNDLEIINLFTSDYQARFYLRQISELTNIPLKSVQRTIQQLESEKVLLSTIEGKNKYFFLNKQNFQTRLYLMKAEIYKLDKFIEKYPEFKLFLKSITSDIPMIIFGSFAKMSSDQNSDVDILIISARKIELDFHLLPWQPHLINLSPSNFNKALSVQEALIKEVENNHIILNNLSFWINAMWGQYAR